MSSKLKILKYYLGFKNRHFSSRKQLEEYADKKIARHFLTPGYRFGYARQITRPTNVVS